MARAENALVVFLDAQGDLQSAAAAVLERLRHKGRIETVLCRNGLDNGLIVCHVVGCGQRIAARKVDLVLSGAVLVAGCGGIQPHLLQGQTDLTACVFALVQRCNVQITALVAGNPGGLSCHVGLEQIELTACSHFALIALFLERLHGLPEIPAQVALIGCAVHVIQLAEKADHTSRLGPPGQDGQGGGVRFQKQVLMGCLQAVRWR